MSTYKWRIITPRLTTWLNSEDDAWGQAIGHAAAGTPTRLEILRFDFGLFTSRLIARWNQLA